MKIISYSFDVANIDKENVSKISEVIKEIDTFSQEDDHLSEVIITTSSSENISVLEDELSDQILRSTSIKVITSDKRSKSYTRPTLVADMFIGDVLILTRTCQQMKSLLFYRSLKPSIYSEITSNHLSFISADSKDLLSSKFSLYSEINRRYSQRLIPHTTFGFAASRQSINSIMSSERDIYDLFIALATSNINRSNFYINASFVESDKIYSRKESLEILSKFSDTSYLDHFTSFDKFLIFFSIFSSIAIVAISIFLKIFGLMSLLILFAVVTAFVVSDAIHSHLSMLSRQSFAAANKKYVAGNAIVYQINKKN